jgi:hypothetical protein
MTKRKWIKKIYRKLTPLNLGGELRCSWRVNSSYFTCGTRCVILVITPVVSHEWGKDRFVITTNGMYLWSFITITKRQVPCTWTIFWPRASTTRILFKTLLVSIEFHTQKPEAVQQQIQNNQRSEKGNT